MADIVHDTLTLPNGLVNVPYEAALAFHGNATAITGSSVSSGTLPPGLVLDAVLPFSRITGTPTTDGLYKFRITLTNAAGSVETSDLTIRIETFGISEGDSFPARSEVKMEWPLS